MKRAATAIPDESEKSQPEVLPPPRVLTAAELEQVAGGAFPFIQTAASPTTTSPMLAFPFTQTA